MEPVKVKVWNDNFLDHKEMYKDEWILIKAGGFVEMPLEEAQQFLGQFYPMAIDGDGQHKPEGFKKLRMEVLKSSGPIMPTNEGRWTCQACGFEARSEWELDGHVNALHLNDMVKSDEKEERQKEVAKRGPGRPPRGAGNADS